MDKGSGNMKCFDVTEKLERLSPHGYACEWDNVGLLVGRKDKEIHKIMVSLDASGEVIERAIENQVDLLVTHHPILFSPIKQLNQDYFISDKVLRLAEHGINCYAMHTNFDAVGGMAELAAGSEYLNLTDTSPIESCEEGIGMGRYGKLPTPMTAEEAADYVKDKFHLPFVMIYQRKGEEDRVFDRIAVMPGSGKSDMQNVYANGYSLYLTGDIGHHEGLDAMDMGLCVIDATHYGLEHIFISYVADYLRQELPESEMKVIEYDPGSPIRIR